MKIGILENNLKMEVLNIKFKNENFGKLFENRIFINMKILTLKDEELRWQTFGPLG